jgi:hypothetical protein
MSTQEASGPPKLFGNYNELVFLLIGFMFSVVGSLITNIFSERHWQKEQEYEQEKKVADIYDSVMSLASKRLYTMKILANTFSRYKTKKPAKDNGLDKKWGSYQDAVAEWNYNSAKQTGLLRLYFSDSYAQQYIVLNNKMVGTGTRLSYLVTQEEFDAKETAVAKEEIEKIYLDLEKLSTMMLKHIKNSTAEKREALTKK